MSEIIERRMRHLKRLEDNHNRDFWARFGNQDLDAGDTAARLSDALSADWNRKQKSAETPGAPAVPGRAGRPLPPGWRTAHWKTLQTMAAEYAGQQTAGKAETIRVLEAYEQGSALPPAA
ncbi:hypothetical protein [Roseibium sp.]|uniref:hypothetical protein n=1 Tax=Roseibium sp. TaxID=1936156 RepID=UPI003264D096